MANIERLTKLAEHLETGKLGHKIFDFSTYNANRNGDDMGTARCGTAGCAIGECPIVFPDEWKFDKLGGIVLRSGDDHTVFFDITDEQYDHLFLPNDQDCETYGGEELGKDATRYQVAANIRAFIERVK